jgi:Cdc6-like AAA superfamily ATPase
LETKLILVEGIPGAGKTSTAEYISSYLNQKKIANKLFQEGNLDHPADYESTACLSKEEYNKIYSQLKNNKKIFSNYCTQENDDYLVEYAKLYHDQEINISDQILNQLAELDIYNLSLEKHSLLVKYKWNDFAKIAAVEDKVYIFECCFLQNPLTTMLAYHNASKDYIINYVKELETVISELNPLLILLEPKNIEAQFARIKKERPQKWLDFVIDYVTNQRYGQANNLEGYPGLIKFYQNLAELELNIFSKLNLNKMLIKAPHSNWEKNYQKINAFLKKMLEVN